ncbi:MAG: C25 family cysteine peptidase [bacterium]
MHQYNPHTSTSPRVALLMLTLAALPGLTAVGVAGWVDLSAGLVQPGTPPDIALLDNDAQSTRYLVTVYGFWLDTLTLPEGSYSRVTVPDASHLTQRSFPDLPKLDVSTIVPDEGDVYCTIANLDTVELDVLPIVPSKGSLSRSVDPATIPYVFDSIYSNGLWFPDGPLDAQEPFTFGDFRGMTVQLNVFRHNPTLGKLVAARQFEVTVSYANPQFVYRDSLAAGFLGVYSGFFHNFSPTYYGAIRNPRMTIVTADQFYDDVLPLRDWKMKKGIVTRVMKLSEITNPQNPDTLAIRDTIHNQRYGSRPVTFFLLVGDHEQVPSLAVPAQWDPPASDPRYVVFTPPYPAAFIGRISGSTSQSITSQVDKLLWYERLPDQQPPSWPWTRKALVMASREKPGPHATPDSVFKNLMKVDLERKYWLVDKLYDHAAVPANVSAELDDGRAFVNFLGHGNWDRWSFCSPNVNPVFHIDDVNNLDNGNMYPVVISVACKVGSFKFNDCCFAEAWLRREQAGAVAFYGGSDFQDWDEPILADRVAIRALSHDLLVGDDFPNMLAPALYIGGATMIRNYPYPGRGQYNFNTWHIFGDPSMQVRMGLQRELVVQHPGIARPGDLYSVFVRTWPGSNPPNPDPAQNVVVCLWKPNDNYHAYRLSDVGGYARFPIPLNLTPGPMFVTATKHDHAAHEGAAHITWEPPPEQPDQGNQAGPAAADPYANLAVSPLASGQTFRIVVPSYALALRLCDGAGRVVDQLRAERGELLWQGTDQQGRLLPEGVYFIKAIGRERTEVKKVLLVR